METNLTVVNTVQTGSEDLGRLNCKALCAIVRNRNVSYEINYFPRIARIRSRDKRGGRSKKEEVQVSDILAHRVSMGELR